MTGPSFSDLPLRERKRLKLRETILDTALRLFLSQGYERTTLEQVCEEAETSLRTLLRYFPTKEDLAIGREQQQFEIVAKKFSALDSATPVILAWRDLVSSAGVQVDRKVLLDHMKLFETNLSVGAKVNALQVKYENMLADAFSREAGLARDKDLYGRLLAGMLIAGNRAAARRWVESEGRLDLNRLRTEVVDWALANFPSRAAAGERMLPGRAVDTLPVVRSEHAPSRPPTPKKRANT